MEPKARGPAQGRDGPGGPRAATAPSGTSASSKSLRWAAPERLALTAESFPSQQAPCRRSVARAEGGTQTTPSIEMLLKQQWSPGKESRKSRDGTHWDRSAKEGTHRDWIHEDRTHRDRTHLDWTHEDGTHRDRTHQDRTHEDGTHRDWTHEDGTRRDRTHQDRTHTDWTHEDGTHENGTHKDRTHEDRTHRDRTHLDWTHEDGTRRGRTHQDGAHSRAWQQLRTSRDSSDRDRLPWAPPSSSPSPTEDDGSGAPGMLVTDVIPGRKSKVSLDLYPDEAGEEEEDRDVLQMEGLLPAGLISCTGRVGAEDLPRALRALGLPARGAELRRALELVPADARGTRDFHDILGALSCTGADAANSKVFQPIYETFGKLKEGSIAAADLQRALLDLGVRLPPVVVPAARSHHDVPTRVTALGTAPAQGAAQDALELASRMEADSVEASKLRYILRAMGIHPTEQEFEAALRNVAPQKDGSVNLAAFMTALSSAQHSSDPLGGSCSASAASEDTVGATSGFESDQLAMRDLLACASHLGIQEGLEKASVDAMQEVLEVIRKVKNNQMEVSQLREVLANMGIVLAEEELREALSKVPGTGDDKLNFKEFMRSLSSTGRLSETARKQFDMGELKTGAQMGSHVAEQRLREALGHVAVDGDQVDIQDLDSIVGSGGGPLTSEELHEAVGHAEEDGVTVDDVGSVLATMGIHLAPEELQEVLSCVAADGDKVSVQELSSILGAKGVHLTSKELQEAFGRVASTARTKADPSESMDAGRAAQKPPPGEEDKVDVSSVGSILASMGIHLTPEELQEAQKHVPVDEGGSVSLSAYMRSVMSTRRPSKAEKNRVDVQSLDNILRSAQIHLTEEEMQEVLRQVPADADGRVNLSEFMRRVKTVQRPDRGVVFSQPEKAPPAPGHVSKASALHPLPQKTVLKSILRKTTRECSHIARRRSRSKTAKTLTKKQLEAFYDAFSFFPKDPCGNITLQGLQDTAKELGIRLTAQEANRELAFADADGDGKVNFSDFLGTVTDRKRFMRAIVPQKKHRGGRGDSDGATGILLFEVLSKLVELAALPQKTLLEIVRYYREKFLSCTGQKAWKDSSSLMHRRKKHNSTRKDQARITSFVNAARISFMNHKDLLAYVDSLKACVPFSYSPYAQVPIFPLIPEQEAVVAGRPKKDLQRLERQRRSEPVASFENHFFQKRNWLQEAVAPRAPAARRQQRSPARAPAQLLSGPCRRAADARGRMQAEAERAARHYRQGLALHERARLLRLWRRLRGGRGGLEAPGDAFRRVFATYSWSWNVCQELLTADELRRADGELDRRAQQRAARRWACG